ncbi:ATP-binding protein, partial [Cryobacterium sp. 10I1]|uniref:ATP-binding protein n=1 Tax=Cryobacterium sp. 10I1 TaxID=3048578 RepID=UPI002B22FB90
TPTSRRTTVRTRTTRRSSTCTNAAAMLDRLLHRSVVVTLDGGSYRLRNHAAQSNELRRVTTGTNFR